MDDFGAANELAFQRSYNFPNCEETMSDLEGLPNMPEDFSGAVKLFPLPNLVLFPHVVQPLHIFEPRYCEMLEAALATDSLLAMALLQPDWESAYLDRPPIADTVCVGKIVSHTPTEDGRHNILLVGLQRAKIIKELDGETSYREAQVELVEDVYPESTLERREAMMMRLHELFSHFVPDGLAAQQSFKQLVGKQLPLGTLTDTISFALNLPLTVKQQLLREPNVDVRCRLLIRCMESRVEEKEEGDADRKFPPDFSTN